MKTRLTFKDIPIQGSLSEFTDKLKKNGFDTALNNNGLPLVDNCSGQECLIGKFTNKTCEIIVNSTPISKTVYSVAVFYPEDLAWGSIEPDYERLKDILSLKYGNPTEVYETFPDGINKYSEGFECIKLGLGSYASFWHLMNGIIYININSFNQISIHYEDKIGGELYTKETDSIIYSDI